jgi:hypothetical protein
MNYSDLGRQAPLGASGPTGNGRAALIRRTAGPWYRVSQRRR